MVHVARSRADNGNFSTEEVRKSSKPCPSTSRLIAFSKGHYKEPPNLAGGFASLNISSEKPIRANLIADSITEDTFRIALETWADSVLYSASATWIEHKANARDCVFGQFDTNYDARKPTASPRKRTSHLQAASKKNAQTFSFPRAYKEPPEVICWLNRLDLPSGPDYNYKIRAFADAIDNRGFTGHLNTWDDDGGLNGAAMCWIAFPKQKRHVDCGRFSTNDIRKRTNPREKTSGTVKFKQRFQTVPTVLAALSMLDAAGNADLRVKVLITDVKYDGFRWSLETWGDSTLYAASASWIALGFP
ncbi:hypothetical protein BAUCODRAFT_118342 [Baudoinia panamericana UAMH 10762]|uniref:H-type lectin domain-containing protein n=1 Tax=Baudoinia panamericana (strain UAMH 10762) TaxID=717646 RepID=M2NM60_BAUPA|nr:uncharacterized protein BAUCODRAFT_118342 [Baudoinia panamericana UAMH 10762]EMD00585.1 hypothetical protein BAUCODRAFT_118342 [Baudoinia panamericana UAMH 10762]